MFWRSHRLLNSQEIRFTPSNWTNTDIRSTDMATLLFINYVAPQRHFLPWKQTRMLHITYINVLYTFINLYKRVLGVGSPPALITHLFYFVQETNRHTVCFTGRPTRRAPRHTKHSFHQNWRTIKLFFFNTHRSRIKTPALLTRIH